MTQDSLQTEVDYTSIGVDPIEFIHILWPNITLYKQQKDIIYSVVENPETVVVAGNQLGKDYVAGLIVLWYFLVHRTVRIITTSVRDDHLRVLWGEINNFIASSKYPLVATRTRHAIHNKSYYSGGPLIINHHEIKKYVDGSCCAKSYIRGMVSERAEGMAGHHAPHTLAVFDEASGVSTESYDMAQSWAKRILIFGNPMPCDRKHFFFRAVDMGDLVDESSSSAPSSQPTTPSSPPTPGVNASNSSGNQSTEGKTRYFRKIIRIKAIDSPNVRYALAEIASGRPVSNKVIVPGVLTYSEYKFRRAVWDKVRQTIGLDAEFYLGVQNLLFPPEWLNLSEEVAKSLADKGRQAEAVGIDPGEGAEDTCMVAIDGKGIIEVVSKKTPDTSVIVDEIIAFISRHRVPYHRVGIDRGGGGKQYADVLRNRGYNIRTIAFGASIAAEPRRYTAMPLKGAPAHEARKEYVEQKYVYINRRAQMYGELRLAIDPSVCLLHSILEERRKNSVNWEGRRSSLIEPRPFAIPSQYAEIRSQLAPIPLLYDGEGRMYLPPKNNRSGNKGKTLVELIGHSPNETDALVVAIHVLLHEERVVEAGALW